ncbi:EF-Hand, calmodulin [Hydrogenophaga taeniospiralis CCUG 15921]|uniref:EF-Hand, calmodulin n=1 Tax=Hydrogenophaga taeniospiralis CCUG 15921 TaxID=1281780 RepID=A0A9X4SA48_9BURK|nr:EF-hand domain-containing protein [Hydrogenophaga taeniospiralis]MDG5973788.1 EF-Hand, calmodulin [Hydrogenophaga taeniospiralis CCUG 15921]
MSTTETVGSSVTGQWSQALASIGSALSSKLQDKMLKKADTDGNGTVGQTEFEAALEKISTKYGIDLGQDSKALFAGLDSDSDGALNGEELGQVIQHLFAPPTNTQDFLQSRGNEEQFGALDADGDGSLSMAEFTGVPADGAEVSIVSTTTTTTTLVSSDADAPVATGEVAPATTTAETDATTPVAAAPADPLQALMDGLDSDGDGQISDSELTTFVSQLNSQIEAATRKYNETALAGLGTTGGLNEAA